MNDNIIITKESTSLSNRETMFAEVIGMIQTTRQNVIRVANTALIDLYWKVGVCRRRLQVQNGATA